ncbi:hypothetical protein C7C56_001705 [Massilia glaciei]|uniref:Uncharacterized protein n=2 Tax=Massilia glaciei TaxID=1524097 RepID=A0A2U2I6W8_9BURK|nr:hypothetical protein C7C56_001705 [Massilia glaciei]
MIPMVLLLSCTPQAFAGDVLSYGVPDYKCENYLAACKTDAEKQMYHRAAAERTRQQAINRANEEAARAAREARLAAEAKKKKDQFDEWKVTKTRRAEAEKLYQLKLTADRARPKAPTSKAGNGFSPVARQ